MDHVAWDPMRPTRRASEDYLDHTEHVHGGLVVLNKHGVVDLAEAEEIEDLPDLRKE